MEVVTKLNKFLCFMFLFAVLAYDHAQTTPFFLKDSQSRVLINLFRRQCGPVVRALALRSGDPGFKTRSYHSLNLILVVPGSTSQPHL